MTTTCSIDAIMTWDGQLFNGILCLSVLLRFFLHVAEVLQPCFLGMPILGRSFRKSFCKDSVLYRLCTPGGSMYGFCVQIGTPRSRQTSLESQR